MDPHHRTMREAGLGALGRIPRTLDRRGRASLWCMQRIRRGGSTLLQDRYNSPPFSRPGALKKMSLAFVFPGQGSQSIGMMAALAKLSPVVESTFAQASAVLGYDLWRRCQDGPPE